jgi:tRNA dimethylallyltransferase
VNPERIAAPEPLLIAVLGPTASGKSGLALELAPHVGGEIVNCDSLQMMRYLRVGTAKPGPDEMSRVPHHLFDFLEPDQLYSAGDYVRDARRTCREIVGRGGTPLVVGGTGLYLRCLLEGIFEGPGRSEELRARLLRVGKLRGTATLHRMLRRRDPEAAAGIQPRDLVRIVRALEVVLQSGRPISRLRREGGAPLAGFLVLKLGLNPSREELYDRINRRVRTMFEGGLLDEVRGLLTRGFPPSAKAFEALGYRYAVQVLNGTMSRDEAVELTQRDTRRYAKRQMTWFRRERRVHWFPRTGDAPGAREEALKWLRREVAAWGTSR